MKKQRLLLSQSFVFFFGLVMLISLLRFWFYGWIEKLYIAPQFFFSYYGFEFIKPLGNYTYGIFVIAIAAAIGICLGYRYRIASIVFFLSFTYIELMDKTTYLNHYYLVSLLSFILIFLPANCCFSVDAYRNKKAYQYIPKWTTDSIKLLLALVYFCAGIAKLHPDWLLEALPLRIWLPIQSELPLIGSVLYQKWVAYASSYFGLFYDLCIPYLLWNRSTRILGFLLVLVFHTLTWILFPIGMFPFVMIFSALIFFDSRIHDKVIYYIATIFRLHQPVNPIPYWNYNPLASRWITSVFVLFFVCQILLPFRYLMYPGALFWTEQGYRFSWRVMLMEKSGYASFKIVNSLTCKQFYVDNADFLTPFQQKQMATQPDFILEYAHFLKSHFENQGHRPIQVFVESYVALNGRRSRVFIDPTVDLGKIKPSLGNKNWILPFE